MKKTHYIFMILIILLGTTAAYLIKKNEITVIQKSIAPITCMRLQKMLPLNSDTAKLNGTVCNERFLLSEMKWLKSFRGTLTFNQMTYTFDTHFAGSKTYQSFTGPLTWIEKGNPYKSSITLNEELTALQFSTLDYKLFNGPSRNAVEFDKWFRFFTSTQ